MLGLFKLQGKKKKNHCAPTQYLTKTAGLATKGVWKRREHPWAGDWGPQRTRGKKRVLQGEGTDCPNGRGAKGTSEEGLGGTAGQCFLHQGTVLEGAWCHPLATPGLGELVTHKPLPQAPFETQMSACPSCHDPLSSSLQSWPAPSGLGAQLLLTPQPHTAASSASGLGSQGTAVWAAG